jgi:hypothetical protein
MLKEKILVCLSALFLCFTAMQAQAYAKRFRVQGTIIDGRTKKGIRRIPFTIKPFNEIIEANNQGAFLFGFPKGEYTFIIDYPPFEKKVIKIDVNKDTTFVVELYSPFESQYIQEVEILSGKSATKQPASVQQIDSHLLNVLPALIGERDILKAFAMTAGVTSSGEGAADMQVRGGNHGQNLYLLDGVPLYSTEHFFGMVSVYNPLIVKSAKLYKSGFPVEYGGKVSSVVDVFTEDANLTKFSGAVDISFLSSKALFNIPIVKNKLALAISGRISNYSLVNIGSLFKLSTDEAKYNLYFGDINANLFWKISEKDKLKLTWFNNSDGFGVTTKDDLFTTSSWMDNKQKNLGLNWYRTISNHSDNQLLAYADSYSFDFGLSNTGIDSKFKSINQLLTGINSVGLVDKYTVNLSDKLKLTSGGSLKTVGFSPAQVNLADTTIARINTKNLVQVIEGVAFSESEYQFAPNQNLTAGLRFSSFGNSDIVYPNLEPRMGYLGIFTHDIAISASVGRLTQPVHRLANSGLGIPFEVFMPSSKNLLPESSWNFSLGLAKDFSFKKSKSSIKIDGWYKSFQNISEFRDGYDALSVMFNNLDMANQTREIVTQGKGRAYGMDVSSSLTHKYWSLSADYTLMQATNQFADLNFGKPFAASTDIRHSICLILERKFSTNLTMAVTWQYQSGKPITIPTQLFQYPLRNFETGALSNSFRQYQAIETERNNYRTMPFHKLDISLTKSYKVFKRYEGSYSIGFYNAYNRANPYIYYLSKKWNADGTSKPILKSMSMFPILPSFSWSVKF